MTPLDWIIVAFALAFAVAGFGRGFVVGALSLAGFALGAVLGARLAPVLLDEGSASPYAPLFALGGALLLGTVLSAGLAGLAGWVRGGARGIPGFAAVDGLLGAALSAAVVLVVAWVAGAAALQVPGQPDVRRAVQQSQVLRTLNDVLPPSGPILNALARFDPLPALRGPRADVPPPRAAIARDPEVAAAAGSVVRVLGTACGLGVTGSGWVAGDDLVVTNAHVVAGQDDTTVQLRGTGPRLDAEPVAFDVRDDVAVLRVAGLGAPALARRDEVPAATQAALLGFPENGPYDVRPVRMGATQQALAQDAYGDGPVTRSIVPLRGLVRHGNSGGPLVDGDGRVVGTVFAATVGGAGDGGYAIPNAVVASVLGRAGGSAVSTGPCAR